MGDYILTFTVLMVAAAIVSALFEGLRLLALGLCWLIERITKREDNT